LAKKWRSFREGHNVHNDPTSVTDPSGLVPVTDGIKNPKFKFADGRNVVIKVYKDEKYGDGDKTWVQLKASTAFDKNVNKGITWLQFVFRYRKKGNKYVGGTYQASERTQHYATDPTGKGAIHLDAKDDGNPFVWPEEKRTSVEVSLYDNPDADEDNKYTETGFVADDYLVDLTNKKIYYHVQWQRVSTNNGGTWKTDTKGFSGDQVNKFPPLLNTEKWLLRYDDNGKEVTVTNPFYTK
jgi:hypothetical protein